MSYKLLRFLLTLVGIASLGGFGWSFYDFIIHKTEYNQPLTSEKLKDLNKQVRPPKQGQISGHLEKWNGNYDDIYKLNVYGYVKPPEVTTGPTAPVKPKPRFGPDDVTLSSILYSSKNHSAVYLIPAGAEPQGALPAGDYYLVGDRFSVPAKPGAKLEVLAIRETEVDLATPEGEDAFTLAMVISEVDPGTIITSDGTESATGPKRSFPKSTEMVAIDDYAIGTQDIQDLKDMPDDQIFSAVRMQPARDANLQVRGLRITSIQSGSLFERVGLQADDVVLSVNQYPAKDRADLLRHLRNADPSDTVQVNIERRGGQRTLTYRIPR